MSTFIKNNNLKTGFTLIEVIIVIAILSTMVLGVSQMLQSSFAMRQVLGDRADNVFKLNDIMNRMTADLEHAYIIPTTNSLRSDGTFSTIFRVNKSSSKSDILSITYANHKVILANAKQSDISYVIYKLVESKHPGRTDLVRGEFPRVPNNFNQNPPFEILAKNVSRLKIDPWQGDSWATQFNWNSMQGDTLNLMPQLVRITIEIWTEEAVEGDNNDSNKQPMQQLVTQVYLPYSASLKELKQRTSTFNIPGVL